MSFTASTIAQMSAMTPAGRNTKMANVPIMPAPSPALAVKASDRKTSATKMTAQ